MVDSRSDTIGPRAGRRRGRRNALALCLGVAAAALANAAASAAGAATEVTEITLERNCFGCSSGSRLVLRDDGSATYTVSGNARMGTNDAVTRGSVGRDAFDRLARLALAGGFFQMADNYGDEQTADGAWSSVRIVRGAVHKQVFRRGDAGPSALVDFEAALDALKARTAFAPDRR